MPSLNASVIKAAAAVEPLTLAILALGVVALALVSLVGIVVMKLGGKKK